MKKLKILVPTSATLEQRIDDLFGVNISEFITRTAERRITVIKNNRYVITTIGVAIFSVLALFLSYGYLSGSQLNLAVLYLFALCAATLFFNYSWYREQKVLAQEINLALIPMITACFDRLVMYTHDDTHRKETKTILRESGLLPEPYYANLISDDVFSFFEPYLISVREIIIDEQQDTTRSFRIKKTFHGTLIEVVLKKTLEGVTYISTEGDVFGLSHQEFWGMRVTEDGMEETKLEKSEFENGLRVFSNNPAECKMILSSNFITDLNTWWKEDEGNMRVSFVGNKMYMLLSDVRINIHTSTTSTDPEVIKTYAKTVLRPLWRLLLLIEEMEL